jgi:uncharacterized integral membrane protein
MKARTVAYIIVLILVVVFLLANWSVISMPVEISFLVASVRAPLGVLIVLVAFAIFGLDFISNALDRNTWLRERRELAADMEQLRLRADQVEQSRLRDLRETVERETAAIRAQLERLTTRGADGR